MRLAEVLRVIRAVRDVDRAPSAITIERLSSGNIVYGVKVSGRDVKATAKRARDVFDELAAKYNGGK